MWRWKKIKLFPPFPSRQSFFNRLLHNFVLCWRKPRCLKPPTWLVKRLKRDALFIVKTMLQDCGPLGEFFFITSLSCSVSRFHQWAFSSFAVTIENTRLEWRQESPLASPRLDTYFWHNFPSHKVNYNCEFFL